MTLTQLEYFVEVATCGSFSKAAKWIHISQPSLSIAIHKLEEELGVSLIEAHRKQVTLTEAGRIFLEDATALLRQKDQTLNHMDQFARKDTAELRVAYTAAFADQTIPDLFAAFLKKNEGHVRIYGNEIPSDQIAQALRENKIDVGLCSMIPSDLLIHRQPLMQQPFCLITPLDDLNDYDDLNQFQQAVLLGYHQDYPMARNLAALFEHLNFKPDFRYFGYSEGSIARLVERNVGIAVIAQNDGLEQYKVRILHPKWLEGNRTIVLLTSAIHPLSQAAATFVEMVMDFYARKSKEQKK